MNRQVAVWALAAMVFGGSAFAATAPNIVLIFADDMGSIDLNCFGSNDLHTPHLDALAASGVRFTQFYVGSPVCSPSRAALMTGRGPHRAGVPQNVGSKPGSKGLPTEETTIAEVLKSVGYRTGAFGKWHLGTIPECQPIGQGFDEFVGHWGGCIDNYSHVIYWAGSPFHDFYRQDQKHWEEGTHSLDIIVRETNRFITENQSEPFFIYMALNIPHYPLHPRPEFRALYKDIPEPRHSYAALVSDMDNAIGNVLAKLEETGVRDNTLVVFLSDHGHSTEERASFGGGNAGPYRGAKFSLFEGGIRVPFIASWPGGLPQGEVRDQMATSMDLLPTFAEFAGAPLPDAQLDGKSLATVLKSPDADSPHQSFHWMLQDQWAVRSGPWKLIANAADTKHQSKLEGEDSIFLVNLESDIGEQTNLRREHPERVDELTQIHEAWMAEVQPQ